MLQMAGPGFGAQQHPPSYKQLPNCSCRGVGGGAGALHAKGDTSEVAGLLTGGLRGSKMKNEELSMFTSPKKNKCLAGVNLLPRSSHPSLEWHRTNALLGDGTAAGFPWRKRTVLVPPGASHRIKSYEAEQCEVYSVYMESFEISNLL